MDIQSKLLKCSRTFTDLYQLNARIGGIEDPDIPHSRKLHAAVCVIKPFLKHFGTFDKADTTSYESIHRVMTVALWHKTSKRYESMYSEMSRQTVLLNYSNLNNFLSAYYKNDLGAYCMEKGPESYPEHVVIGTISNSKVYPIRVTMGNALECAEHDVTLYDLLNYSTASLHSLERSLQSKLEEFNMWNSLRDADEDRFQLFYLKGITLHGNEESRLNKNFIYATNSFRKKRSLRYDYIMVNCEDGPQPAKLLALFKIEDNVLNSEHFYAYVRYLSFVDDVGGDNLIGNDIAGTCPFKILKWEAIETVPGRAIRRQFNMEFIEVETIIGPAFIQPMFSQYNNNREQIYQASHPLWTDKFWYLDRRYCDRQEWEDMYPQHENPDDEEYNIHNIEFDNNEEVYQPDEHEFGRPDAQFIPDIDDDNDNDSADDDDILDVEDCEEEDRIVSNQWNIFGLL